MLAPYIKIPSRLLRPLKAIVSLLVCVGGLWSVTAAPLLEGRLASAGRSTGLHSARIAFSLGDSWPTYSGDYSGKRYSALTQINQANVRHLTLAWVTRVANGLNTATDNRQTPTFVGGEATDSAPELGSTTIRASVLQVDGILYFSTPDNAWAADARIGQLLWHYVWKTKGGTHIGNRGLGMWGNYLYMETPDDYLVSLDAGTGKERWHKDIADFNLQYFSTPAPIVVGNHVLVGTGNDLDEPGFLQSFDPETGDLQWKFYTVPMNLGDPGLGTWGSLDAARHGGGQAWLPGSYDPETRYYIFGTGNPTPAYTNSPGRNGDNLFTCSLIAVNVDTGKRAWYYQTSPHDTHDWDSAQTPVLVDAEFQGKPRRLVMTAARNGYFFLLDRITGEHLLTKQFSRSLNWASHLDEHGRPVRNPEKDAQVGGALVSSSSDGATNWPPASFSPETGLFYVASAESYSIFYLTEIDPRGAMGLGGKSEQILASVNYLAAIDYETGETRWRHPYPSSALNIERGPVSGMLTTAGTLLFAGDTSDNLIAYDPTNGHILWHTHLGLVSNSPQTYAVDGRQYVLVASGDTLYAFTVLP